MLQNNYVYANSGFQTKNKSNKNTIILDIISWRAAFFVYFSRTAAPRCQKHCFYSVPNAQKCCRTAMFLQMLGFCYVPEGAKMLQNSYVYAKSGFQSKIESNKNTIFLDIISWRAAFFVQFSRTAAPRCQKQCFYRQNKSADPLDAWCGSRSKAPQHNENPRPTP